MQSKKSTNIVASNEEIDVSYRFGPYTSKTYTINSMSYDLPKNQKFRVSQHVEDVNCIVVDLLTGFFLWGTVIQEKFRIIPGNVEAQIEDAKLTLMGRHWSTVKVNNELKSLAKRKP